MTKQTSPLRQRMLGEVAAPLSTAIRVSIDAVNLRHGRATGDLSPAITFVGNSVTKDQTGSWFPSV